MARTQTMVQLTDDLIALLDREAARRHISRSALIRSFIEAALHDDQEQATSRRIVDGYLAIPQATPDEWGRPADPGERATSELLARLDAEERDAGFSRW